MILSPEQETAIKSIKKWRKSSSHNWLFFLAGYAGTGKTTLLQEYINGLEDVPICLAPTGKAASVLQKKLKNAAVTTIHTALYSPLIPDISKLEGLEARLLGEADGKGKDDIKRAIREEKERLADQKIKFKDKLDIAIMPGELVIVDEASMVTNRMLSDLENTGAKVLFVGDPGQLPPVGDAGYFTRTTPDSLLTQVQRQAAENPIIALSMAIREGRSIPREIDNAHILRRPKAGFPLMDLLLADQIMTGRNAIRRKLNRVVRNLRGVPVGQVLPVEGERLLCLKNQFKFQTWLVNGVPGLCTKDADFNSDSMEMEMDVLYEGGLLAGIPFYPYHFQVHYRPDTVEEPWAMRNGLAEFDFGYAITVHKSQGSEWDRVLLVDDEMQAGDKEFRKRWLYTAVTRAKNHLTWLPQ